MAKTKPVVGERGVCILTASIAGYEGQIGQTPYAASKAGVIGLTLCAARDLASRGIRVCTIAPGIMDAPMLGRLPEVFAPAWLPARPTRRGWGSRRSLRCWPARSSRIPPYLNGEAIRLDGALRMGFR
jgi:NAD(P)-dependent dehydrogenase (short-subunit alcohol dehydrogenase family)